MKCNADLGVGEPIFEFPGITHLMMSVHVRRESEMPSLQKIVWDLDSMAAFGFAYRCRNRIRMISDQFLSDLKNYNRCGHKARCVITAPHS